MGYNVDMQIGCVYPQIELGGDPGAVKAFAQAAEGLGYDHLVVYDHVIGAEHEGRVPKLTGPYTEKDPFHEPLVMFAYLAGVTEKLGLMTGVIILPQRQTALVAKQAADVDLFSGERLRFGVGVGWNWVEFDALELSDQYRRRGAREESQITLLRELWGNSVIDHTDSDHRIDRAGILPLPKRQIPIWLGGFSKPAWDRAARIGDGFLFAGRQDDAVENKAYIETKLAEAGRSDVDFGFERIVALGDDLDASKSQADTWRGAGGSHFSVVTMGRGLTTVDEHIDAISRWRGAVS